MLFQAHITACKADICNVECEGMKEHIMPSPKKVNPGEKEIIPSDYIKGIDV